VTFNNAWTGSDSLRILKMCIEETADIERLLKICPQLKQSAYNFNLTISITLLKIVLLYKSI